MKILSPGKLPRPDPLAIYKGTCSWCKCKVEVSRKEISFSPLSFLMNSTRVPYTKCPTMNCDNNIRVFWVKPWYKIFDNSGYIEETVEYY